MFISGDEQRLTTTFRKPRAKIWPADIVNFQLTSEIVMRMGKYQEKRKMVMISVE